MDTIETDDKVRENRLRRVAARRGYRLSRSRARDPLAIDYGTYGLYDTTASNSIVGGTSSQTGYGLDLDDVEEFLNTPEVSRHAPEEAVPMTLGRPMIEYGRHPRYGEGWFLFYLDDEESVTAGVDSDFIPGRRGDALRVLAEAQRMLKARAQR